MAGSGVDAATFHGAKVSPVTIRILTKVASDDRTVHIDKPPSHVGLQAGADARANDTPPKARAQRAAARADG